MPKSQPMDGLELAQDLVFQRRSWIFQRIGWLAMLLIVLAALLGLFGPGPLSQTRLSRGALQLDYQRFERYQTPTELRIQVGAESIHDGQAQLWISRDYLRAMKIEQVTPQPEKVLAKADRLFYSFRVANNGQPLEVAFHASVESFGLQRGQLGLADGETLSFSQFVYP